MTKGFRLIGILAMAVAIAHCGDSDVRVSTGPGVVPSPGTFTGTLSDGGSIRIEVGSIEEVVFDCDEEVIRETFTPPREIENDGSFSIGFSDGGREFRITGQFRDNNTVDGTINDEDNECDVSYDAFRGGGVPTAVPTPTGGVVNPTATGGTIPTPTGGTNPTPTDGTGPNPTNTPGPTGSPCPIGVEVLGNSTGPVLDAGWSGLGHNQSVIQRGKLSFSFSDCDNPVRPCGVCQVGGPIPNPKANQGDIASQRCTNATETVCSTNADCSGGTCAFFFGAPLPLTAGGTSTCVVNRVNGNVTGTANIETGDSATKLTLVSSVFLGDTASPCPQCVGNDTPNDGVKGGTCDKGRRQGQPCDVNGEAVIPSFGATSLDCYPAGSSVADLNIDFSGSTGTETRTLSSSSPDCFSTVAAGKKCFCPTTNVETRPNGCTDDTATPADGCQPTGANPREGLCADGPIDQNCAVATFQGCISNADCPAGDSCGSFQRPCFLDNGEPGGSVVAQGEPDPPQNGVANPTFAAMFCIDSTRSSAVNTAAGLPGLGRVELPLLATEIPAP